MRKEFNNTLHFPGAPFIMTNKAKYESKSNILGIIEMRNE
ncbi:hypothetical protein T01_13759 [Trichinella spiralis]|uniref:Uncharacterized protein n=1 Tax=Trichinella spiralis TaxID=6334 RepID=A0A0V1AIL9_TRISP|nr:hypothetical protein T01_13759 [Trichinella spiralis]